MRKLKIILISGLVICTSIFTNELSSIINNTEEIATAITIEVNKSDTNTKPETLEEPEIYKEPKEENKTIKTYYNIPLSKEIQDFIFEECKKYNISIELVLAIMDVESNYQSEVISETNDYGLMQINIVNHGWLSDQLDINNLLDEKQNITAGIYMLSKISTDYAEIGQLLMVYNRGELGAKKLWEQCIYETRYTKKVINKMDELKGMIISEIY